LQLNDNWARFFILVEAWRPHFTLRRREEERKRGREEGRKRGREEERKREEERGTSL
jgi:hypothetical protein